MIGRLGNTGNSDAPHLHFHIMNGPGPLSSDGLPFELRSFTSESTVTSPLDRLFTGEPRSSPQRCVGIMATTTAGE